MFSYHVVFDAASQDYVAWKNALPLAGFSVVSMLLWALLSGRRIREETQKIRVYRNLCKVVAVFGAVGTSVIIGFTWCNFIELRSALKNGAFDEVEGVVNDFVPEGMDGHPMEKFRVGAVSFRYSSSDISSAFHQTRAQGGPIREGLHVRIATVNGAIARLEIER